MSSEAVPAGKILGAMFIITGTCVGAGMLALPVAGAEVGLLPSLSVMLFTYVMMTLGGLFYLEASLWFSGETHIVSMSDRFMGQLAKYICSAIYLFIAYVSLTAYLSEGAKLLYLNIEKYFGILYSPNATYALYLVGLAVVLLLNTKGVSKISSFLVICMVVTYFGMLSHISPHLDHELLATQQWQGPVLLGLTPLVMIQCRFKSCTVSLRLF